MTIRWTEEQLEDLQRRNSEGPADFDQDQVRARLVNDPAPAKPHKYRAEPTEVDGIRFDSKLEARFYCQLRNQLTAGQILGVLRQVPFHLPGKTRLVLDFQIFNLDGTSFFVDTKGFETEVFKVKLRQVRELYPWARIEIITRKDVKP